MAVRVAEREKTAAGLDGNAGVSAPERILAEAERVFARLIETHGELPERPTRTLSASAAKSSVRQVPAPNYGS